MENEKNTVNKITQINYFIVQENGTLAGLYDESYAYS